MTLQAFALLAAAALVRGETPTKVPRDAPRGAAAWEAAHSSAAAALGKLSQQDKINIVTGVGWNKGPCVGNTPAISSINYPQLCLQDGPLGVRFGSSITAFTPGIQAASTWDVDLIRQRGEYMGAEFKGCGIHVQLGPVAGPLGKVPQGGRNWEGFGVDPYLTGIAMAETIEGIQSAGVQATAKHYILNEQELNRETMSSNVDDRTLHELYLWPFADAVHSNVASVMCSYNKINGTWACENDRVLNVILKQELGFPGYVMSDWNAQHSTDDAANHGMDMTMPGSDFNGGTILWGPQLDSAVNSGRVPKSRLDDMVERILAAWYLLGQDSNYPAINIGANVQGNHKENVRAVARDGIVLLKNDDGILPLKKPAKLALIGSAAVVNPQGLNSCQDQGCNKGALGMGWGSGAVNYPYFVAPYDALKARAQEDGTTVSLHNSDSTSGVANVASDADAAIVVITADSGEGYITVEGAAGDRLNLDPWHNGNELVKAVAAANKNTIVVVHSVGPIILETILATEGVKAIVWAGLPSQENGNALVDILYGLASPSGKLVYTIAKREQDYGTAVVRGDDTFPEGLFVDYRHFDKENIEPRYEFGFGLSYTNFTYADLELTSTATAGPATGETIPGGAADLWEEVATVTATITNSGGVDGAEVAQLYLTLPSSAPATPPKQLRGFAKLKLAAGASGTATFSLRRRDLSYWDTGRGQWVVPEGEFGVSVGASSRDIRLTGSFRV
ncbi:glycoside hydrolase family 3 protein [Thermothelomyces thermophilus ATCC 42464]|uniref:Beta-glucosidase cel3A n=1 Tax=Thermothelomyces thermophilus (strain ATCC 42464 / BCRC 31852 / DSM 1799) TaxID=573729 RepID=G2QDN2_THET4|nr:glycoside hydrolase family 3 protein [Thermothelomyces thermophilus ATCC 42464]AEO58343.1 glycoside hydrolase family 3 protein [Thermothelomyces thermophilus ATCC 42464]